MDRVDNVISLSNIVQKNLYAQGTSQNKIKTCVGLKTVMETAKGALSAAARCNM